MRTFIYLYSIILYFDIDDLFFMWYLKYNRVHIMHKLVLLFYFKYACCSFKNTTRYTSNTRLMFTVWY